jgi:hypothetical protein
MRKFLTLAARIVRGCTNAMDRISFRVTALLATTCLAIASSDAYADGPEPPSDPGASAVVPPAPEDEMPTLATGDDSDESRASGDAPFQDTDSGGANAQQDGAFAEEEVQPTVSETAGDPSPPATGTPKSTPAAPAAQGVRADQISATPPAAPQPLPAAVDPPTEQTPPSAAASPASPATAAKPGPLAPVTSEPAAPKPRDSVERRVSGVGRELRNVQGQIHDLRRGLADGAPPPASRLNRLRATLERVTPMVIALEVRLQAAGRLSPHLRHLLHRVRGDLQEVHVAAAGLVAALHSSGARSPELRLLLRELEAFLAVGSTLAPNQGVDPMPASAASVPGGSPAPTQLQPTPVASPPPNAAGPPAPRAGSGHAPGPSHAPARAELVPSSAAPGSATASPAGSSFFFAAVAGVMALLLGIALPALWARLHLPPGRLYAAAFLTPLERPG